MNLVTKYLLLVLMVFHAVITIGQSDPEKAGRIEDGKLILKIDLSWNEEQRAKLARLFDLDSLMIDAIFENDLNYINTSTDWKANINRQQQLEISKLLDQPSDLRLDKIILSPPPPPPGSPAPVITTSPYGINNFRIPGVFAYEDEIACFILPGYNKAQKVFLSGSFNQWSTMQLPMEPTDSGWVACIGLPAGKHHYKYIVDGRWMTDPNNRLRENDGQRGQNSVGYCYNHNFELNGYTGARRVIVAGSFNGWNTRELRMEKTLSGWELPIFLREGTHTYKFIVDGSWITDPANPNTRPDGSGNLNSLMSIGDTLFFRLKGYMDADQVILSGSFNDWNTGELKMEKDSTGWVLPYVLANGNYEYKYIVDGKWMTDPDNPFTTGSGDFTNSFMVYNPNYMFKLKGHESAERVILSGTFNRWSTNDYKMVFRDGEWVFPIYLLPGRYSYKFIIDGEWIADPDNPLYEKNEFGGENSVIWIE